MRHFELKRLIKKYLLKKFADYIDFEFFRKPLEEISSKNKDYAKCFRIFVLSPLREYNSIDGSIWILAAAASFCRILAVMRMRRKDARPITIRRII